MCHNFLTKQQICLSTMCCICCECCDCCSLPACVLLIGVVAVVTVPVIICATSFMITWHGWGFISPFDAARFSLLVGSIIGLFFMIGFLAGYCGKKAWGRWMMFYSFGLGIILTIALYITTLAVNAEFMGT